MSEETVQEAKIVTDSDEVIDSSLTTSGTTPTATTTTTTTVKTVTQPKKINKKKDKNDPTRFEGEGVNFNAKLIGIDDVPEARGDRMCQETIYRLKLSVKASGQHKQRIIVNVSEDGIKLIDLRTGVINYTHAVHKVSFIARDITDGRAFGYIYGVGDGSHKFFAIKTEKAAENLVLTLRDLFQVVYDKKRKEMDEVKQRQEEEQVAEVSTEIATPPPAKDPNVLKLEGDFNQESSTDEEPIYQVPTNGAPIYAIVESPEHIYDVPDKGKTDQENIVELENELVSIEQGIEQMNKIESDFDAFGTDSANTSTNNDPWGALGSSQTSEPKNSNQDSLFDSDFTETLNVPTSAQSDLQELDLFSNQPVVAKKKEEILNLFGSQPQGMQTAPPFGAGQANPMGFNTSVNPGITFNAPNTPFPTSQGQPFPMANPFGAPSTMPGMGPPPPVPSRPTPAANPFGNDPFFTGSTAGAFDAFPNGGSTAGQSNNIFDENILAPVKLETAEPAAANPPAKIDAFGDLGSFGKAADTSKTPKDLFADLKSVPKKSMKELISEKQKNDPSLVQASDEDPFGSLDSTSPAMKISNAPFLKGSNEDPFDTSFVLSNQRPSIAPLNPVVIGDDNKEMSSEDFDLPSPNVPPPPLPLDTNTAPPAPPPRPSGTPTPINLPTVPPRIAPVTPPKLPPRNANTSNSSSSAVPRPRPMPRERTKVQSVNQLQENTSVPSPLLNQLTKNDRPVEPFVTNNKVELHNGGSRTSSGSFVIEDPFIDSDPFVETADAFLTSFDEFTSDSRTGFGSEDPFFSPVSLKSSHTNQKNDIDCKDDPFAVFDNCLNDSFNFKNSNSRKNSKKKKAGVSIAQTGLAAVICG